MIPTGVLGAGNIRGFDGFPGAWRVGRGMRECAAAQGWGVKRHWNGRDVMRGGGGLPRGETVRGAGPPGGGTVLGEHVEPLATWGVLCGMAA